jgi:hypothetical protein
MPAHDDELRDAFPELAEIESDTLRGQVVDAWVTALEESEYDSVRDVPRSSHPVPGETSDRAERIVDHVRDVAMCTVAMADFVAERFDAELDRDVAIAGALTHDVSKVPELSTTTDEAFEDRLPHPHYAVHQLAAAGLPLDVIHIAISHSPFSGVEPNTLEATVVYHADMVAINGLFWAESGDLPEHV